MVGSLFQQSQSTVSVSNQERIMYRMNGNVPDPAELEKQQDDERSELDKELEDHDKALGEDDDSDDDDDDDDSDDDDEDNDDDEPVDEDAVE
jgi:hypothetical protein